MAQGIEAYEKLLQIDPENESGLNNLALQYGNFEMFDDAGEEIRDWLTERLDEAAGSGLAYPYDGLTLVEVPNALRGYAGGWRMDTTFAQPAMILVRESSFPTARFDRRYKDTDRFKDREGGVAGTKRRDLERFMERLAPDGDPLFRHTAEGPDDMPAHVRSVLTQTGLSIPIDSGRCDLGTWQGIYLWEHRSRGHRRRITVSVVRA